MYILMLFHSNQFESINLGFLWRKVKVNRRDVTLAGLRFNTSFNALLPPVGGEQYYRKNTIGVATVSGGILARWGLLHKTVYTAATLWHCGAWQYK